MKSFEWANAASVEDAVKLLGSGDAKADPDELPRPMGGGQDLLSTMKAYITRPPRVVNLKTMQGHHKIEGDASKGLTIGALVTIAMIESHPEILKNFPGLAQAAESIATPQIRNLGTIGGNLCQRPRCWYFRLENIKCRKKGGDTCYAMDGENKYHSIFANDGASAIVHPSDLAPMLMALDATLTIYGAAGKRDIPIANFFTLPEDDKSVRHENVLAPGEVVAEIHIPPSPMTMRSSYQKFKERASLDFAMSATAAAVELNADKTVKQARVVLGGVAPIPWRVPKVEAFLVGKNLDESTIAQAAVLALKDASPLSQNGYKVPLAQTMVRRALAAVNA